MKRKIIILFSFTLSTLLGFAQSSDPYQIFGHSSPETRQTQMSDLYRLENDDTASILRTLAFDFAGHIVYKLDKKDSVIGSVPINDNEQLRWLTVDPLTKKYPNNSPYSFCSNNPVNKVDMDGRDDFTFHTLTKITSYYIPGRGYETQSNVTRSVDVVRTNSANTYTAHNMVSYEDLTNGTKTFRQDYSDASKNAGQLLSQNWDQVTKLYPREISSPGTSSNFSGLKSAYEAKEAYQASENEDAYNQKAMGAMLGAVPMDEFIGMAATSKLSGRLGNAATRTQISEIAAELESRGYTITRGGRFPEEYLQPVNGGRKGGSYIDLTATHPDYGTLRINTVDVTQNGLPTTRELNNATRIRQQIDPGQHLLLVPKD